MSTNHNFLLLFFAEGMVIICCNNTMLLYVNNSFFIFRDGGQIKALLKYSSILKFFYLYSWILNPQVHQVFSAQLYSEESHVFSQNYARKNYIHKNVQFFSRNNRSNSRTREMGEVSFVSRNNDSNCRTRERLGEGGGGGGGSLVSF